MVKTIATLLLALTAAIPNEGFKEAEKEPLCENGSIIVRVLPKRTELTDGNYAVEENYEQKAQSRYEELKKNLDEKFSQMFELKAQLDAVQSELSAKWDEYYALHEKYNRELKRVISAWLAGENYSELPEDRPVPYKPYAHPIEK